MINRLNKKVNKLQTYKMFEGEPTVYVERKDVNDLIDNYGMTLDEIKEEAERYGYILVKRNYDKLIPCKCGCNKRRRVKKDGRYYIECKNCERYAVGDYVIEAVKKWNEIMTPEKKVLSEEHKQHLSESAKAYWDKKRKEENAQDEV